ncbi:predicted protein [Plenodomus lingam JN3]|uniref:Predicted protein n=1 Tax=Leptosphaeria maculans (strain JN3 / isolate v23.1.3 / race Av1-4-5-6-7-8) TaxID=985895 RepID=E4ZU45_LEPMJ|nr:predicted protein [Plenodomus lingam JN3]CBX94755.1 predicted protein [Plenodomus lingam JN3]
MTFYNSFTGAMARITGGFALHATRRHPWKVGAMDADRLIAVGVESQTWVPCSQDMETGTVYLWYMASTRTENIHGYMSHMSYRTYRTYSDTATPMAASSRSISQHLRSLLLERYVPYLIHRYLLVASSQSHFG